MFLQIRRFSMLQNVFDTFSNSVASEYGEYIANTFDSGNADINRLYYQYTSLDSFYPRPILAYLGTQYKANNLSDISTSKFPSIIFIPQIVRDFLAIHDDVIDEDLIKFNTDTLPFAISKLYDSKLDKMSTKGKNLSILFADYTVPIIYNIAYQAECDKDTRLELINAINRVLLKTNIGQIKELELEQFMPSSISESEILELYNKKAADYCYAFPFELGLIYAGAPMDLIEKSREILLKIGACSQVVNDIEGVFFESYGDERDTFSDLLELRRTYLLVKLSKMSSNEIVQKMLEKNRLNYSEAQSIKQEMINCSLLESVCTDIKRICSELNHCIDDLSLGNVIKEYIQDLIRIRVLGNLEKVSKIMK